ncbi:DUF5082 family protein [Rummeliibacillus sp. TYF005]|uniref:YwqH-like family protein n=1 Tax=Rummeliibacillus sp. TYF005 TaxID=2058214 RepID=UPI002110C227|nr:DUF5082 family protein [Rummeliibacillus sp. TYF005]
MAILKVGVSLDKAGLISRRSVLQRQIAQKRQQITILNGKIERLKAANAQLVDVINESNDYKKKVQNLDIDTTLWKGITKNKYEDLKYRIEQSLVDYNKDLQEVEESIEEEIVRLYNQLQLCYSEISSLQSSISSLNHSIEN